MSSSAGAVVAGLTRPPDPRDPELMMSTGDHRVSRGVQVAGWVCLLAVVVALSWYVLGAAGTVVLGSTWLLALGLGRAVPVLRGPVTWVLAVLGTLGLVLGGSAVHALIAPGRHGTAVWVVLLALPGLAAGVLLALPRSRRRAQDASTMGGGLAAIVTLLVLGVFAAIGRSGPGHDVAWALSGDARNHALMMRGIFAEGGLTIESLKSYPAAMNGFAAVLAGPAGRTGAAGQVVLDDAHALAVTYVLCAIALACAYAAAVVESVPAAVTARRLPAPVGVVALAAAAAAGTPMVIGTALSDGFFSAYGALVPAMASVVVGLRFVRDPASRTWMLLACAVAAPLTYLSWTVLVVVPAAVLLVMVLAGAATRVRARRAGHAAVGPAWIVIGAAMAILIGLVGVTASFLPTLRATFALSGSIQAPAVWLLPALVLGAVALAAGPGEQVSRRQGLIPLGIGVVACIAVLLLRMLAAGPGLGWTYYSTKTAWLVACSLLWLPLVAVARWVDARGPAPAPARFVAGFAAAAAAVAVMGTATGVREAAEEALQGWNQPSASAVLETATLADRGGPFVVWQVSDVGNDRIANFWAALAWASKDGRWLPSPGAKQSFPVWAYFMDDSDATQLCSLAPVTTDLTVYTSNPDLTSQLAAACPTASLRVVVVRAGSAG